MTAEQPDAPAKPERYRSLDVFRGATVAGMILANNPGSWSSMYPPLQHAKWHGCTPTDWVFPFFLFAVGIALAWVWRRQQALNDSEVYVQILRRTALLFAIGLFLSAFPFVAWNGEQQLEWKSPANLRILGVLQRIALAYGIAALSVRVLARDGATYRICVLAATLLLGYWILCRSLGAAPDPFSLEGFIGTHVDRALLGPSHLYRGEGVPFDPEGLLSTIPAVSQVLLGWWTGVTLLRSSKDESLLGKLLLVGVHWLLLAFIWQIDFPLNKKIWSSTFVLHTSGLALFALSLLIYWGEISKSTGRLVGAKLGTVVSRILSYPFYFFEAFGKNPLFLFVLSGLIPRGLGLVRWQAETGAGEPKWVTPLPWLYQNWFVGEGIDPRLSSLLYSLAWLAIYGVIAIGMERRNVVIKV
jgi:predicted acyltransferase